MAERCRVVQLSRQDQDEARDLMWQIIELGYGKLAHSERPPVETAKKIFR
jgi:hypothetical protein